MIRNIVKLVKLRKVFVSNEYYKAGLVKDLHMKIHLQVHMYVYVNM